MKAEAGDQKSASIGVCASSTANIGAAAIAVTAKMAIQTKTTMTRAREPRIAIMLQRNQRNCELRAEPGTGTGNLVPVRYSLQQIRRLTLELAADGIEG